MAGAEQTRINLTKLSPKVVPFTQGILHHQSNLCVGDFRNLAKTGKLTKHRLETDLAETLMA